MRRKAIIAALVGALCWSCFEVEQEIELKKDLSGTAKVGMKIDLEPMIAVMASMQHAFGGGKQGGPSKAELGVVKKELLAKYENDVTKEALAREKARLQGDMPDGVKVTRFKARVRGSRVIYDLAFRFDDVTKLGAVKLDQNDGSGQGPQNPMDRPFTWRVVDEGETLLIDNVPPNLSAELMAGLQMPGAESGAGMQAVNKALANMKLISKITVPYAVVDSNATRTRGKTLTWSFDSEAFEKMTQGDMPRIFVRMKKPPGLALGHLVNLESGSAAPEGSVETTRSAERPAP